MTSKCTIKCTLKWIVRRHIQGLHFPSYSAPNKRSATTYSRVGGRQCQRSPGRKTPGQFAGRLQGIVARLGASRMHFQNPPVLESASKIEYMTIAGVKRKAPAPHPLTLIDSTQLSPTSHTHIHTTAPPISHTKWWLLGKAHMLRTGVMYKRSNALGEFGRHSHVPRYFEVA